MAHLTPSIIHSRVYNLLTHLRKVVLTPQEQVRMTVQFASSKDPVAWAQRETLAYQPIQEGETWGGAWDSAWFHCRGKIPASWAGETVVLQIDVGGECMVFDDKGCPVLGLTKGSVFDEDYHKDLMHLPAPVKGGESLDFWVEGAANQLFGIGRTDPEHNHEFRALHGEYKGELRRLRICRLDRSTYDFLIELELLNNLMQQLPEGSPRRAKILLGLDCAVGEHHRAGSAAARAVLAPLLKVAADPGHIRFTGVGHAHIDTAWLWPLRETIRKTARTFASQIGLIDRYPGYIFGASQAQLYAFIKEHHPLLYAKVKAAVRAGRWEIQGAMWVEADCNIPSGESLVRQCVLGKRFFKTEFGVEVKNLWLPDVFGYSGQLPQILRKAGVPYFLTQKLSWNRMNEFPHNTFIWRGIDGSEVLSHFPPENDYNARCWPAALVKAQERLKERGITDEAISLFGIGNGGGGPKEEFLERALRMADLNGCPPLTFGHAQPVLERMDTYRDQLSTWSGELYFEMHRATYTTQTGIKRSNRRAEEALAVCEMLCAVAGEDLYPRTQLERMWKTMLTHQFHDIIPGSSIHQVYAEAVPQNDAVAEDALSLAASAAARVLRADAAACTVLNPSATAFDDLVALPDGWTGATLAGSLLQSQEDDEHILVRVNIDGHAAITLRRSAAPTAVASREESLVLENDVVRYVFDAQARVVSMRLLADDRELLAGPANAFTLYEDRPHTYDAWDIDEQYRMAPLGTIDVCEIRREHGPLFDELRVIGTVGQSSFEQRIRLRTASARLDFITTVDWNERHKLLRVAFPTTLVARDCAYEMQYGFVRRPTHRNTSWDAAQFEVCGHRWADLSERTTGVALLTDCKYGYACRDGELSLSLLRAPTEPDPVADIGLQRFTYSLLPHLGDLFTAPVRNEAAMINAGTLSLPGLDGAAWRLPIRVEGEGLELAVVKAAEDAGQGLIVRVIEVRGTRARARLFAKGFRIVPTDLMEWEDRPDAARADAFDLDLGAFAIETFRLLPA
jgi:alpha-mannosidase